MHRVSRDPLARSWIPADWAAHLWVYRHQLSIKTHGCFKIFELQVQHWRAERFRFQFLRVGLQWCWSRAWVWWLFSKDCGSKMVKTYWAFVGIDYRLPPVHLFHKHSMIHLAIFGIFFAVLTWFDPWSTPYSRVHAAPAAQRLPFGGGAIQGGTQYSFQLQAAGVPNTFHKFPFSPFLFPFIRIGNWLPTNTKLLQLQNPVDNIADVDNVWSFDTLRPDGVAREPASETVRLRSRKWV